MVAPLKDSPRGRGPYGIKNQGARRVWSDSQGRIRVAEWLSGNLSLHNLPDTLAQL